MKRKTAFLLIGFLSMLLLPNCKKDKTGNNPDPIGMKVKIFEYGSNLPLANVKLSVNKCIENGIFDCINIAELRYWTSGVDGNITILASYMAKRNEYYIAVEQEHWTSYVFDTLIAKSYYDSAIIRMYPFGSIKFHFKSTNSYPAKEMLRFYMKALPENKAEFEIDPLGNYVRHANNLDTIFTYKTYGNVKNRLVVELLDSNFVFIKKLIDEKKFIAKASLQEWNINY